MKKRGLSLWIGALCLWTAHAQVPFFTYLGNGRLVASTPQSLVFTFGDVDCYLFEGGHDLHNLYAYEDEDWAFYCNIDIYPGSFVLAEVKGAVTNKKTGTTQTFGHQVPTDFDTTEYGPEYPPFPLELDEEGNFGFGIVAQDVKRTSWPAVNLILRGTVLLTDIGDWRPVTDVVSFRVVAASH